MVYITDYSRSPSPTKKPSLDPFLTPQPNPTSLWLVFPGATWKPHSSLDRIRKHGGFGFSYEGVDSRVCNVHYY